MENRQDTTFLPMEEAIREDAEAYAEGAGGGGDLRATIARAYVEGARQRQRLLQWPLDLATGARATGLDIDIPIEDRLAEALDTLERITDLLQWDGGTLSDNEGGKRQ